MSDWTAETVTLEDVPNMRARLVVEDYPEPPFHESGVPTYRVNVSRNTVGAYGSRLEHVYGEEAREVADEWWDRIVFSYSNRADTLDDAVDFLDRFLRIFHGGGARVLSRGDSRSYDYIVVMTQAQLRNWCSGETSTEILEQETRTSEYLAWLEGEVYGIVIEQAGTETTVIRDMQGTVIRESVTETWEEVESVWGFYGDAHDETSYIQSEARAMLEMHGREAA